MTRAERAQRRRDAVTDARRSSRSAGRNEAAVQTRRAADEDRRRVRTVTTPARQRRRVRMPKVKAPRFATVRRRGRRTRRSRRELGTFGLLYWITAALLVLALVVIQTFGWGLVALLTAAASVVTGAIATRQEVRYGPATRHASRRTAAAKRRSGGSGGSGATRHASRRRSVCTAACRNSSSPRKECDCPCGGKTHGVKPSAP